MPRLILAAAALALLLPADSRADGSRSSNRRAPANVIPAAQYGAAKPSSCKQCGSTSLYPPWMHAGESPLHPVGPGAFGDELRYQLLWDEHECAPDGCIKPLGCGNLWTEVKFLFGSCRQFFGTAESTVGHHRNTRERWATPYQYR
jgi:hypothetical protein